MQTDLTTVRRNVLKTFSWSFVKSWSYFVPDFHEGAEYIQSLPEPTQSGQRIWNTRNNTVVRITLPQSAGGYEVAYKQVVPVQRLRYLFQMTLAAKEAVNYYMLGKAGFPMAELLGVGETRSCCFVRKAFFITRFASGYQDGLFFLNKGQHPYLDEFIRTSMRYLAKMHDMNYFHRGFKVYNVLWKKEDNDTPMDFVMIDVATGRLVSALKMQKKAKFDVGAFFENLDLPAEEVAKYTEFYCSCRQTYLPPDLPRQVEEYLKYRKKLWVAKHSGLRLKWRQFRKRLR